MLSKELREIFRKFLFRQSHIQATKTLKMFKGKGLTVGNLAQLEARFQPTQREIMDFVPLM